MIIGWQCADDVVVMLGLLGSDHPGGTPHVPKLECQKNQKAQTNTRGRKKLLVGPIFGAFWCVLELGFLVDGRPLNDD